MAKSVNGIFISYRREDAAGHAGRLFDRLAAHFGKASVFMDVEGIEAGVDFVETIETAVGGCDVLLAVIGRGWLECKDSQGNRRLDDPQDFIRLETSSALSRNVRVIPVLVEGARMPRAEELPDDLRLITRRQALELRDSRWEDDIQALIAVLERVLASATAPPPASENARKDIWRAPGAWAWKAGAAALLLGAALIGYQWWLHERDAAIHPSPMTETQPPVAPKPDTPTPPAPSPLQATEKLPATRPPTQKPETQKPVVAKPAAPATPPRIAAAPPAPRPREATAPQSQPKVTIAPVAPPPVSVAPRKIAVIALGEPTFRGFWEGERRAAYSAKIAGRYRDVLREAASGQFEFGISIDNDRDMRMLEKALRETPGLCDSAQTEAVFVARLEEPQAISQAESAYWPELRLTAISCDSGKQYNARSNLSPRRGDSFPFEREMTETMEKFAREYRRLLQ